MRDGYGMKRRDYLRTVGAACGMSLVAGCQGESGETAIVPGTASTYFPYEFTRNGELVGFDIDLTEEVIGRTTYELAQWTDTDYASLSTSLSEGDIDFIAAPLAATTTEAGQKSIVFTDPYYEPDWAVLVAEDGGFQPDSLDDLSEAAVGARPLTWGMTQVEGLLARDTIGVENVNHYDTYTLAVRDLENGTVDALVLDSPTAENLELTRAVDVALLNEADDPFYFKMRQDDERIDAINDAIAEVIEDGTYGELVNEWFDIDV